MPFRPPNESISPLALPEGFDLNPDASKETPEGSVLGAALRQESPIVSGYSGYSIDYNDEFDPSYRIWDDIQGTPYEEFADRFVEARNASQVEMMKAQIDRENEDRKVLDAAGPMGMLASMGASLLSPTTLLPGGAVASGVKGSVSVGKTAVNVAGWAGVAASLDEFALHQSQATRTGEESAFAIGGSIILGGLLGAGAGALSRKQFADLSSQAEELPAAIQGLDAQLRSVGAAENTSDFTVRREQLFQYVNKTPVLRGIVRSDPILRAMLSDNTSARAALADLVDTPLQYAANEQGNTVGRFAMSAETAINARRNEELSGAMATLNKQYSDYVFDGEVGLVGRMTAPLTGRWSNLTQKTGKFTRTEFMQEVGKAAMSNDTHPIPQVQKAAQEMRARIFDKIKDEAIEVGMFDADIQPKNADSYFMRVYNREKIEAHRRDGSENDFTQVLEAEFKRKRAESENRLAFDSTVAELEAEKFKSKERARTAQTALNKAIKKARNKKQRATAAVAREQAIGRVSGALRTAFKGRSKALDEKLLQGDELTAFKEMVKDARSIARREPEDLLSVVRGLGGLRDDGSGELQQALDTKLPTVKRSNGMWADDMRGALEELGYLPEGSTEADFWDALRANANGDKVYSSYDAVELDRFTALQEFVETMDELGIDLSKPIDDILRQLPEKTRSPKITKAKSQEAGRSARKAGNKEEAAADRLASALDRLEEANARLAELDDVVGPKVREEIQAAKADLKKLIPELKKAKAAQASDEYYAGLDDASITSAVDRTVDTILGVKPGEHWANSIQSNPTKARVLDVADSVLEPWLETDMGVVLSQYYNAMVPDIEITRRFGDLNLTEAKQKIVDEMNRQARGLKDPKAIRKIKSEANERIRDLDGMTQRIRGIYGVPDNPDSAWVRAGRLARTTSYMGYLGGMTLSALPDVAGVIGRNGIEAAFGSLNAITNPKRFTKALEDQAELGASAEWFLNSRAVSISEVSNPYGANTRFERGMGWAASGFGVATGMVPWNIAWKAIGGAFSASKMSKAAMAVSEGNASKKQLLKLSENGIDRSMALRIAEQIKSHGDRNGLLWLPQAGDWADRDAFEAFRGAMNREMDLMIVTPGQDKPLTFSSEAGKFFSQFKSFAVSSHHRIVLSGIQRADGAVLSQVLLGLTLGAMVSKVKAQVGGYEQKEGGDLWLDALDRSGLTGWLMEAAQPIHSLAGSPLGEPTSRFQSRSMAMGLLGPSVDMGINGVTSLNALSHAVSGKGKLTERDVRNLMRPVPGNNIPYLLWLTEKVSKAVPEAIN